MKQRYQVFVLGLLLVLASMAAYAQRTVSGTVTDQQGNRMPGVNVIVQGTSSGTTTDSNGRYTLDLGNGTVLVFSFIGYQSQEVEVGARSTVDVTLAEDVQQLSEVLVTAMGVERETKALGYSVTQVGGELFQDARTNNLGDQLTGRIAGVNASKIASGPAGSSRVIIRGNTSLLGNNQPLYVVDGLPMDNSQFGNAGLWGGSDQGDGMTSINPDDIESITVLKGASAAALYGARAANGVINIVTKKGSARRGLGIEVTSNFVFEQVNDLRDYQTEFGQGEYVRIDPSDPSSPYIAVAPRTQTEGKNWNTRSWGPRLGSGTFIGSDGVERPYVDAGDNFPRFFETGYNFTNTIALTGGSEAQNFRLSFSDLRNTSIVPNTGFDRTTATLATNSKFGERLTIPSKIMYSHEFADNRTNPSDSPNNAHLSMYYIPANTNLEWYKGDPNKLGAVPIDQDETSLTIWGVQPGWEMPVGEHLWHQNPYWVAYQFDNDDTRDRIIASGQARYDITDWLWVQGRAQMDWYTRRKHIVGPQGTQHSPQGSVDENESRVREINIDWMAGVDKTFGRVGLNAFIGGQTMRRTREDLNLHGGDFNVPFFEVINFSVNRTWGFGFSESGINSLFGSVALSYNNVLFLTATGRQDWFSVLNPANNSVFYPSVSASFVFSDAFQMPTFLSFGKLRAGWARVGNATIGPYDTNLTYSPIGGASHVGAPIASFTTAGGQNGLIPNQDLVPLEADELELGIDLRFLNGRIGLDFTYYSKKTTKDILNATISKASGFSSTSINLGEMTNKGIEVLITGKPVTGTFNWDVSLNLAKNTNEVVSLIEGSTELLIEEPRSRNVWIKHMVGHPFGTITGRVQKLDPQGRPIFLDNGRPVMADGFAIIGNGVPDLTGGLHNGFTFKNWNLGVLIDFKAGGDIFSGTNNRLTQAGFTKMSLQGREGEEPLTVVGSINVAGANEEPVYEPFELTLTPQQARSYWGDVGGETNARTDLFVYDASFIKLRQVTLGYSLPRSILDKTPFRSVRVAFIGRNLAIIHKNTPNIDPESSYSSGNGQGLEYFGFPSTRSYGFDLKLQL
ncbi:MAG: SusC/RagA family TonB-linked outer membrane protein [Cyclobacteriaceae bacterium]|nr:SusC/RagA family TonB-linked outer membrane protein [Cyclobacteriaceae bacterium]